MNNYYQSPYATSEKEKQLFHKHIKKQLHKQLAKLEADIREDDGTDPIHTTALESMNHQLKLVINCGRGLDDEENKTE